MAVAGLIWLLTGPLAQAQVDPLPSWNDGPTKRAILGFVRAATDPAGPGFVPADDRIATFDNDGTLWVEQPIYTQVVFAFDRVKTLATGHPEWKTEEPFRSILSGNRDEMTRFTIQDFVRVIAATHSGMSEEEFHETIKQWLATAEHPRYKRRYTDLVYQPMLDLMRHLRANGFKTYIVTGGGQEFVRAFAGPVYGVPPEQVIGSAGKVRYEYDRAGKPVLVKLPSVLLLDDKAGKPEGINLVIGRRPRAAFGNSIGDRQMLEWTQAGPGARLMMLVRHDDSAREYSYGEDSKVGTFSAELREEALRRGWVVISMKNDWKRVFPFEKEAW
ncbi:MAG: haloacid dehalogenase-like hydrolase [Planctomycetaceae bacterium]|nr:haloacid dehalogenase-like hydrolase [Planctomycetaceae bacterium]